jgi:hypothetical protein
MWLPTVPVKFPGFVKKHPKKYSIREKDFANLVYHTRASVPCNLVGSSIMNSFNDVNFAFTWPVVAR